MKEVIVMLKSGKKEIIFHDKIMSILTANGEHTLFLKDGIKISYPIKLVDIYKKVGD